MPVNLFAADAVADPVGTYERLRGEHGPVAPVLIADDLPAWLILGYRENLEVARTPARFTRDSRVWNLEREGKVAPNSPVRPFTTYKPMIRFTDGAEHQRVRSAFNDSLAGLNRRGIRRYVTRYANRLIDEFCTTGSADLITQFVQHLPMLVLSRLLGLTEDAGIAMVKATQDISAGAASAVAGDEMIANTLGDLVAARRQAPENDLASWLIGHPARLADVEVVQNLRFTVVMANETTSSLMGSTLRLLLTDLRFRASLAGGQMTLPDAVEQVLWDEPPFRTLVGRWATSDTEVGGQKIRAGDLMLLGIAAGNADPSIRPDLSAPLFGNRSHLAFGGGPHECPGQDFSRAICETGIDTLLGRLPDLALAVTEDELNWKSAWVTRHLATLPVGFTRRRKQGDGTAQAPDTTRSAGYPPEPAASQATEPAEQASGPYAPVQQEHFQPSRVQQALAQYAQQPSFQQPQSPQSQSPQPQSPQAPAPMPAQQLPEQQSPFQQAPEQQAPDQTPPLQHIAAQQPPGQQAPGQQSPGQQAPDQQSAFQHMAGQQPPEQPSLGQQPPDQTPPLQHIAGQQMAGQQVPGQHMAAQQLPGQSSPFQPLPAQPSPFQQPPAEQTQQYPVQQSVPQTGSASVYYPPDAQRGGWYVQQPGYPAPLPADPETMPLPARGAKPASRWRRSRREKGR